MIITDFICSLFFNVLSKTFAKQSLTELDFFPIEHLKPSGILVEELLEDIKTLKDENKIRIIYKVVKCILKD